MKDYVVSMVGSADKPQAPVVKLGRAEENKRKASYGCF